MKHYIFIFLFLIAVTGCKNNTKEVTRILERSTPEAQGVSSQGIIDFLNEMNAEKIEAHSFMFLSHGKVIAEGWWKPYGPEYKHIMFSASKSITSLGVGIAIDEGLLHISDKVISFFPEYMTDSISENMKLLTVKDLLTMSVGQEKDPAFMFQFGKQDWISGFLHTPPVHTPGTVMMYNNFATFMLSAIVQKVSGQMLFNYLGPRLFDPLYIKDIDWDYNYMGINLGMIGSRLHIESLTFSFANNKCKILIKKEDSEADLIAGIGNWEYGLSNGASLSSLGTSGSDYRKLTNEINRDLRNMKKVASIIGMNDENTMILTARFVEESLGSETWELEFSQSGNTTEVKLDPGNGGRRRFGPPVEPAVITGKIKN